MTLLHELLEDAIARAGAFSGHAGEAIESVTALLDRFASLDKVLAFRGEEAHGRIQDLARRLQAAEDGIEASAHEAASRLDALEAPAADVRGRVAELVATIRSETSGLEALEAEVLDRVDGGIRSADEGFGALFDRLQGLHRKAQERSGDALSSIARFRHEVALAGSEFEADTGQLLAAMADLTGSVRTEARAYADHVAALLVSQTGLLVDMGNRMLTQHNETVVPLRRTLTEEAPAQLAAALQPVQEAVTALIDACRGHESALEGQAVEILQRVDDAVGIVARLTPLLQAAERLP